MEQNYKADFVTRVKQLFDLAEVDFLSVNTISEAFGGLSRVARLLHINDFNDYDRVFINTLTTVDIGILEVTEDMNSKPLFTSYKMGSGLPTYIVRNIAPEEIVFNALKVNPDKTAYEISKRVPMSMDTLSVALDRLLKNQRISLVIKDNNVYFTPNFDNSSLNATDDINDTNQSFLDELRANYSDKYAIFTVKQIMKVSGRSEGGVRSELGKLAKTGVISKHEKAQNTVYTLDTYDGKPITIAMARAVVDGSRTFDEIQKLYIDYEALKKPIHS